MAYARVKTYRVWGIKMSDKGFKPFTIGILIDTPDKARGLWHRLNAGQVDSHCSDVDLPANESFGEEFWMVNTLLYERGLSQLKARSTNDL
ncbi:MAG: hypothetical protein KAS32_02450 [Candidatus Peribacteraceae bacterium]|nr:hypothetical protein [Candidatus Peribacteraceae bacterium]